MPLTGGHTLNRLLQLLRLLGFIKSDQFCRLCRICPLNPVTAMLSFAGCDGIYLLVMSSCLTSLLSLAVTACGSRADDSARLDSTGLQCCLHALYAF